MEPRRFIINSASGKGSNVKRFIESGPTAVNSLQPPRCSLPVMHTSEEKALSDIKSVQLRLEELKRKIEKQIEEEK